jgi:predicted nucleic acid-binding protein
VISELRKGKRCNSNVAAWYSAVGEDEIFLSVLTIGKLRRGIDNIPRRDTKAASALNRWLGGLIKVHGRRILPIDHEVAEEWGRLNVPDPLPMIDGLLAATAKVHGLSLATRNTKDIARAGIHFLNPFV